MIPFLSGLIKSLFIKFTNAGNVIKFLEIKNFTFNKSYTIKLLLNEVMKRINRVPRVGNRSRIFINLSAAKRGTKMVTWAGMC